MMKNYMCNFTYEEILNFEIQSLGLETIFNEEINENIKNKK